MTWYNSLNLKLSNAQFSILKSEIKNETGAVLTLLSNMIGNPDDETNFPNKSLLTNRKVPNRRKDFLTKSII